MRGRLKVIALAVAMMVMLAGCGSSTDSSVVSNSSYYGNTSGVSSVADSITSSSASKNYSVSEESVSESYSYSDDSSSIESDTSTSEYENTEIVDEMLVYRAYIEIETLNYDETYDELTNLINEYGARIESETYSNDYGSYLYGYRYSSSAYVTNKTATIQIRVPSEYYAEFVSKDTELGNVISKQTSIENITESYYDNTAVLESLQKQQDALMDLLDRATEVEDMITLTEEIYNLQLQINSMQTTIRTQDMDVAYSYVTIYLVEVVEYSEETQVVKTNTFLDRLYNTCVDSLDSFGQLLEDVLFGIIMILPELVLVVVIIIVIKLIFGKRISDRTRLKDIEKSILEAEKKYEKNNNNDENVSGVVGDTDDSEK